MVQKDSEFVGREVLEQPPTARKRRSVVDRVAAGRVHHVGNLRVAEEVTVFRRRTVLCRFGDVPVRHHERLVLLGDVGDAHAELPELREALLHEAVDLEGPQSALALLDGEDQRGLVCVAHVFWHSKK